MGVLSAFLIASMCLCDVFVFKTVSFFGFSLALSGVIFPITSLIMICINEIYGHKKAALSLISLVSAQLFFLVGLVFLPKIPSPPDFSPDIVSAYNLVFKEEWRVFLSSPVGISVTLYLSSVINSKLKIYFWGKYLIARTVFTSAVTTAVLVSIIYPINFLGILNADKIFNIIIDTYVYKMIMAFLIVYLSYPLVFFLRKAEKKYVFDINASYSPFHVYTPKSRGINLYDKFFK